MQIELSSQLEAVIREKVESGEYPDVTAVIAAAVELLAADGEGSRMERLRRSLRVGTEQIDRGEIGEWTPGLYESILENARRKARDGRPSKPDVLP